MIKNLVLVVSFISIGYFGVGCASSRIGVLPPPSENVMYVLAEGKTFQQVVVRAAAKRRWESQLMDNGVIRCTLRQRKNVVAIDIVPTGNQLFSIRPVQSNIDIRKFEKWIANLKRDIVIQAGSNKSYEVRISK